MSGWIKLHRSITDHWLYTEKRQFSKFEAWNDILLTVNFTSGKSIIKGKVILINRGESILSLESWGKRWSWNKSAVKRFFDLLKKDDMIELKNETVTTRLIVCNYDSYQSKENADETQVKRRRNADETQTKPIEEEEERKEEKENNIENRKLKFSKTLTPFLDTYGRDVLNSFYDYWTEPNKSNTKFRQELEKTWSLKSRLERWIKNSYNPKTVTEAPIQNKGMTHESVMK